MNRIQRRRAAKAGRIAPGARSSATDVEQVLATAARHRKANRLDAAAALYWHVLLEAAPEQPDALHWLGVLEHKRGRDVRALTLLERAAALRPRDPLCLYHLGEVRRASGRFAEAVESYRQALSFEPGVADIYFGLGTALLDLGSTEEGAAELRRALDVSPDDPEAHNNLANALADLGQFEEAIAHYRTALELRPGYAEAHMNLGIVMVEIGRDKEAEACCRDAIAADRHFVEARLQLARCLLRLERVEESAETLRRVVQLWRHAEAHNDLGRCLVKLARFEEALGHYRKALELKPNFAEAHFNIGVCLQSEGRFEEAVEAHERALALRPGLSEARYNLALIQQRQIGGGEAAGLQARLEQSDLADRERINIHFVLGNMFEMEGEVDIAFDHYRHGNDLKSRTLNFSAARYVDFVDRLIATCNADFFAARKDSGVASGLPVFIVGMPRSGTTLVEQILASHPAVYGAGELEEMRHMIGALPGRLGTDARYPECAQAISPDMAKELAREYLDSLRGRSRQARRVTDKMTGNYVRLGLIAQLLPKARVIHCRRDAMDTCVSCYFQNFANGLSFTYDLSHLGLVYRQYERLMDHWSRVLPLPVLEVRYESLIENLERVSRRIVAFCSLPWDARCLDFHKQERHVRTASFWQVRQPLYTTSVGRWRTFSKHLGPLLEALGDQSAAGP